MKLKQRYSKYELVTLLECIKPYERWTKDELKAWARDGSCSGFRHFIAANITPIERYRPKPSPVQASAARPQRKPAAQARPQPQRPGRHHPSRRKRTHRPSAEH
jgi:hypothetical protein